VYTLPALNHLPYNRDQRSGITPTSNGSSYHSKIRQRLDPFRFQDGSSWQVRAGCDRDRAFSAFRPAQMRTGVAKLRHPDNQPLLSRSGRKHLCGGRFFRGHRPPGNNL